jgi:hypothetical protein
MMSYNILTVSARLAINDVVQASSVNAVGMREYILNILMTNIYGRADMCHYSRILIPLVRLPATR